MQNRSFVALLVGASVATFAGVFYATGMPTARATAQPAMGASIDIVPPPPDRYEMPESVKPEPHPAMAGPVRRADTPGATTGSPVYYPGCDQVRVAGRAPLYRGQPGYRSGMDGDDDGIACEDYR